MTPMLNILVLYPEHLNLNGDAANAGVLARRMNWYGLDAAIDFYHPGDELPAHQPDFVLLGHGSAAAWKAIEVDFARIFPALREWVAAGVYGLAVNSGQERLHDESTKLFGHSLNSGARVSEFVVAQVDWLADRGMRGAALGYQNSTFDAPLIERVNNFVGTQLHGPVLAKNGELADWFIRGVARLDVLQPTISGGEHLSRVAEHQAKIWELEAEVKH